MSDEAPVSSLEITNLAINLRFATCLASLPREVRDIVYVYVFSNTAYTVGFGRRYYVVSSGNKDLDTFLIMIHEEAIRSRVARELCQAFWSVKFSEHSLDISWEQLPDLLNPGLVTTLETTDRILPRSPYGTQPTIRIPLITTITPRKFVSDLEINVNDNKELNISDKNDLRKLTRRLAALLLFPGLRCVEINLWVPRDCDCYWEAMPLIESISSICKLLRSRIRRNLSVWIMRNWPHHRSTFQIMDHDVSWMWEQPGQEVRMLNGVRPPTGAEDRVRTLLSNDVPRKESEKTLLEQLRDAASSLPQMRDDIAAEEGGWKAKEVLDRTAEYGNLSI